MVSHCYGLMANMRKCANSPVLRGAGMEFEQYLTVAREQASLLAETIDHAVTHFIMGGWQGVMAFGLAAFLMFLLTSLISPRR